MPVLRAFGQSAFSHVTGSSYCAGLDPILKWQLIEFPQKPPLELKSFPVAVVRTHQKPGTSAISSRNYEKIPPVRKPLFHLVIHGILCNLLLTKFPMTKIKFHPAFSGKQAKQVANRFLMFPDKHKDMNLVVRLAKHFSENPIICPVGSTFNGTNDSFTGHKLRREQVLYFPGIAIKLKLGLSMISICVIILGDSVSE